MTDPALQQYLTLYGRQKADIEAHAPATLNRWRALAREALEGQRLPDRHTPGYEHTSIAELMAPDLGVNINRLNLRADVAAAFRCDIPNMSTLLGVVVGDMFHPTESLLRNLPEGVIFGSLSSVAHEHPELLERWYGSVAPIDSAPVALNTLMAQDGVMLYVPRGVEVPRPLQLVNLFAGTTPMAAFRRLLVVVEDGAACRLLLCDHTQTPGVEYVASQVVEVHCGRGARLDIYDIEKSSPLTRRHCMTYASLGEGASAVFNATTLTNGITRNSYAVTLDGEHADTLLTGMAIASGQQHVDNSSTVEHRAPRCKSNQLFKYALDGEAHGVFGGSIIVGREAPYTEAYQSNRNIVASQRARMNTSPTLLIYNDEVRCSHGATTGQIDEEALFYMRTRGIPEAEARTMLMQAFMVDVIDAVRLDSLRDRLRHLVEKRFCQGGAECDGCRITNTDQDE